MGLVALLRRLFAGRGHGVEELAERLGVSVEDLQATSPLYREFTIPKRAGGTRKITAPDTYLKGLQRRILRRLLNRLSCHSQATGFERGRSIVTNALPHVGKAVIIRMDLQDFFPTTSERRVRDYFRKIGWNRDAAAVLTRLCTYEGGLPQGAPTSPRLSNLVNRRLDARLAGLARKFGATYTRYADDITFSLDTDDHAEIGAIIRMTKRIVAEEGYRLHHRRKLHIRRQYNQQLVTGIVVNETANLPRRTRRWLRAVEHRAANGRDTTLSPAQLAGWRALQEMVARQTGQAT